MTQSTQKKKGRKPKAKMNVVSEPTTQPAKPKKVAEPKVKEAKLEEKTYQAEKWVEEYVNESNEPQTPIQQQLTDEAKEQIVKAIESLIEESKVQPIGEEGLITGELDHSWYAIQHTEKKSIWQKIVSFFTGK